MSSQSKKRKSHQDAWNEKRRRLETYRDAHGGDCNVPQRSKDDLKLGQWVNTQKVQFRKFKKDPSTSRLSVVRVSALEEMGAIASWNAWEEKKRETLRQCEEKKKLEERKLAKDLEERNLAKALEKSRVALRRVHLQEMESWSLDRIRTWEEYFSLLKAYRDVYGHCNIPNGYKKDPDRSCIYHWVHRQQYNLKKYALESPHLSSLNMEKISLLANIGAIKSWGLIHLLPKCRP